MDELKLMPCDKINVDKMMYEEEQDSMIDVAVESDEVILT
jgi:phage pi2 protein 07